MFVITNRTLHKDKSGLAVFGRTPNDSGPNELRLVKIVDKNRVDILDDELTAAEVAAIAAQHPGIDLSLPPGEHWYASLQVASEIFLRARREKKHILLYVHGYNNDLGDVYRTAQKLEKLYNVIPVIFSWPANGGGPVSGAAAYLSDKDDARASASALHRAVGKIHNYHRLFTRHQRQNAIEAVQARHPTFDDAARRMLTRKLLAECDITLNLLCHSMGNYVLKYASQPGNSKLRELVFDNIAMVAADVNNPGHADWLPRMPVRNRFYVVINENDSALAWSRRKPGDEQLARLGHHLRNLDAPNAVYIDVTRNKGVGDEHSYFKDKPVEGNATLKQLFARIFEGGEAEKSLEYHADLNLYRS